MDETGKEYILQWSGHAASITERFSGLLARQALVDVTLICQEQKLRVHKLEMLEQDLGQEPIIVLKDLDFDILKAMVEFMYCGETTIAHCHLQSLLDAAQIFKVRDLESIVNNMMESKNDIDRNESLKTNEEFNNINNSTSGKSRVQVKLSGKETAEKSLSPITLIELFDDTNLKYNQSIENILTNNSTQENEYTASETINSTKVFTNQLFFEETTNLKSNMTNSRKENLSLMKKNDCDDKIVLTNPDKIFDDCLIACSAQNSESDSLDVISGVGECSKVYTHKKRNPENSKKSFVLNMCDVLSQTYATDSIDLSNDLFCDTNINIPITLPSVIDTETTDYTWNLTAENIYHVPGTINQSNIFISDRQQNMNDETDAQKSVILNYKSIRQIKEIFSVDNDNISIEKTPILRRSVRLNQSEDNSVNSCNQVICQKPEDKAIYIKRESLTTIKPVTKSKRKIKESETKIADENIVASQKKVSNNSRSVRSAAKIASKRSNNSRSYSKITKHEPKAKTSKLKNMKLEKIESLENEAFVPLRLNTIASVDRALWGDMSDILENQKDATLIPEHSLSKEIPFAVGLLPLHAALERMQAIPDYQPRKTRSSFAPSKQEFHGLKRKLIACDSESWVTKKQCSSDHIINTSSTDCHIKIQPSSQCYETRTNLRDLIVSTKLELDKR
ncbi:uncharacterized protein [Chelonus insularis]|uniref:uncharacterized protein isoform X2 n=1 Tax=Chelonus insularis TaxID=460826 RepID=UPI00158C418F|nr:uncharacterized protein LOC118067043 isoform X2 [Chelonus insularis]